MNIYVLDRNDNITLTLSGVADNTAYHFFNGVLTREINTGDILEFDVDVTELGEESAKLVEERGVIVPYDDDSYSLLTIKEVVDTHENNTFIKSVYCEHACIELADEVFTEVLEGKHEIRDGLSALLKNTRWEVGTVADNYIRTLTGEYYGNTVLACINTLASEYDVEVEFRVDFVGNNVVRRYVNIESTFGRVLGKRFEYRKDVTSITRTVTSGDIKTAIIPVGTLKKEGVVEDAPVEDDSILDDDSILEDEPTTEEPPAEEEPIEETITIEGVEWVEGKNPVSKPYGQNYLEIPSATEQWGYCNADGTKRPRFLFMEFSEVENAEELISLAYLQLNRYTVPAVTYEVGAVDLYILTGDPDYSFESVRLGDYANIIDHSFNPTLTLSSRVVKIERDLNDDAKSSITFGTIKPTLVDKDVKTQILELQQTINEVSSNTDLSGVYNKINTIIGNIQSGKWEQVSEVNNLLFGSSIGYTYISKDNGVWVYDKPTDQNPTKAVVLKGGQIGLASYDLQQQRWVVGTFIDGNSVNASMINTGTLSADRIEAGTITAKHFTAEVQEDINGKVSQEQVETMLESSADNILLQVSSKYSTKEEVEEQLASIEVTDDRITQVVSEKFVEKYDYETQQEIIRETISQLEQTVDSIDMNFTEQVTGFVTTEEFEKFENEVTTNIKFNENGVTIGRTDSEFKTNINNKQMTFSQAGEDVAYINSNKFFITNGEVTNQLILGGYEIQPRTTNGNLSFMWRGFEDEETV